MDIQECKEKKKALEQYILNEVISFEKLTSCIVSKISLVYIQTEQDLEYHTGGVKVTVEL